VTEEHVALKGSLAELTTVARERTSLVCREGCRRATWTSLRDSIPKDSEGKLQNFARDVAGQ
jgi:hypothetical protein